MEPNYRFKIILIGNSPVWKSSLILRFSDDTFNEIFYQTIGVDFSSKTFDLDCNNVKLQIWDTSGDERFKNMSYSYYKNVNGIIMVYDITNKQSFKDIDNWFPEVEKHASGDVNKMLVGNKCDLEGDRQVSYDEGKGYADQLGIKFIETSAKESINVASAFSIIRYIIYSMIHDTWYMIHDIWYIIHDIWYIIHDTWYMIHNTWYMIYDIWYMIYDIWYMIHDIWYMMHDT